MIEIIQFVHNLRVSINQNKVLCWISRLFEIINEKRSNIICWPKLENQQQFVDVLMNNSLLSDYFVDERVMRFNGVVKFYNMNSINEILDELLVFNIGYLTIFLVPWIIQNYFHCCQSFSSHFSWCTLCPCLGQC